MSDNKKWFKVWTTILNDEGFEMLSDELIGCWVRLGARTALIGTSGQCRFLNEASFTTFMRCKTFKEAVSLARKLPNLTVSLTPKNDNDTITVTHFTKWKKHQEDSTSYDRVKRYRERHRIDNDVREEEKRREKKRGETHRYNPVDNSESVFADKVKKDMETKPQVKPLKEITDDLTQSLEKHKTDDPETPDLKPF